MPSESIFQRVHTLYASLSGQPVQPSAVVLYMNAVAEDPECVRLLWRAIRADHGSERLLPQLRAAGVIRAATSLQLARFDALLFISKARVAYPTDAAQAMLEALPVDQAWCAALFSHDPVPGFDVLAPLADTLAEPSADPVANWFYSEFVRSAATLAEGGLVDKGRRILDRATNALLAPKERRDGHASYALRDGLMRELPRLSQAGSGWLLTDACDWLDQAIAGETWERSAADDASPVWRPAIENHGQNIDGGAASTLVEVVREIARANVESGRSTIEEVCAVLRARKRQVFTRICLHLLNSGAGRNSSILRSHILDRDLLESYQYRHEYSKLVTASFGALSPTDQAMWLKWVNEGRRDLRRTTKRTAEEAEHGNKLWRWSALGWVSQYLRGNMLALFEQLCEEYGPPSEDEFFIKVTPYVSPPSPVSSAQLATMPFAQALEQVVAYFNAAAKDRRFDTDMLMQAFGTRVQLNLQEAAGNAMLMIGVQQPRIQRAFIAAVSSGLKNEHELASFEPLLELSRAILKQPPPLELDRGGQVLQEEHERAWVRESVVRLFDVVARSTSTGVLAAVLPHIDEMIQILFEESKVQPASSDIIASASKPSAWRRDWYQEAINCSRGRAIDTFFECVRIASDQRKQGDGSDSRLAKKWDELPGVREALEWHLQPENASVEVLTVLGVRIGMLFWIDETWVMQKLMAVEVCLPAPADSDPLDATRGWATWNAFVVWHKPHPLFLKNFSKQYMRALSFFAEPDSKESRDSERPAARLMQHLVIYYCWEEIPLSKGPISMEAVFSAATPELRRETLSFLGMCFEERPLPSTLQTRLMELWDAYWGLWTGKSDATLEPRGWTIGHWFARGLLAPAWSLKRLKEFVEEVGLPEPHDLILIKLGEVAGSNYVEAMAIYLQMLIKGRQHRDFHADYSFKHMRAAVRAALHEGGESRAAAEAVLEELGRDGVLEAEKVFEELD